MSDADTAPLAARTWRRNGDVNVMPLDAAADNLRQFYKGTRADIKERLLAGQTLGTPHALFCLAGRAPDPA